MIFAILECMTKAQNDYFTKMLIQLEMNKLQEEDMYQLFQDMVNHNYVWDKPRLALHARLMIEKKVIQPPYGYVHRTVEPQEVIEMKKNRKLRKAILH